MVERRSINKTALLWRIEPLLMSLESEERLRPILEARPEEQGRGAIWQSLRRQDGKIIRGYAIIRGTGLAVEIDQEFIWKPLQGVSEQQCLNRAFDRLKQLNGEKIDA